MVRGNGGIVIQKTTAQQFIYNLHTLESVQIIANENGENWANIKHNWFPIVLYRVLLPTPNTIG